MDPVDTPPDLTSPPPYTESTETTSCETTGKTGSRDIRKAKTTAASELELIQRPRMIIESGDTGELNDEEFEDETLVERLIGLTEMFPESFRNGVYAMGCLTASGFQSAFNISKNVSWFVATTATLCFLPLFLELERVQTEEQEAVHQRTMMLGPRAASGGSSLAGFTAVPHLAPIESK